MLLRLSLVLVLSLAWPLAQSAGQDGAGLADLSSIKKLLKPNEAVLVFRKREAIDELVVLGTDREQVHPIRASAAEIQASLGKLYKSLRAALDEVPTPTFDVDAARQLAAGLSLQALAGVPAGATVIVVTESEPYKDIPFHVLVPDKDLLAQSYDVAIAPSLAELVASLQRRQTPLAAQIGTPTFSDKLGTDIANNKYLQFPYMTVFSEDATETYVKENLPKASLTLLAPHGWFDEGDPSRSYLAFGPTNTDDGRLHAHEAEALRLKPGLVFVDACDLGRRLVFPELLLRAGASTVIASYWGPTLTGPSSWIVARTMKLLSEGKTAAFAVSQAQREMLARARQSTTHPEYVHPAFWAPFVVIGNWR